LPAKKVNYEQAYIAKLNRNILPHISYDKLDSSCNSGDAGYAAEVLKELNDAFAEVYGTNRPESDLGFATVPAILRGRSTGRLAVGLVTLDLESAGEHYGSCLLTKFGVIQTGTKDNSREAETYFNEQFRPYDYWYTVEIDNDIHVDFNKMPPEVVKLLTQVHLAPQPGLNQSFHEGM
jgi:hypothetical protein